MVSEDFRGFFFIMSLCEQMAGYQGMVGKIYIVDY